MFQAPFQIQDLRTEEGQKVGDESYVVLAPIMTKSGPGEAENAASKLDNSSLIHGRCGSVSGAISNSRLVLKGQCFSGIFDGLPIAILFL